MYPMVVYFPVIFTILSIQVVFAKFNFILRRLEFAKCKVYFVIFHSTSPMVYINFNTCPFYMYLVTFESNLSRSSPLRAKVKSLKINEIYQYLKWVVVLFTLTSQDQHQMSCMRLRFQSTIKRYVTITTVEKSRIT